LTLREENRLRVFEKRVMRIFGPKRDEIKGDFLSYHNQNLFEGTGETRKCLSQDSNQVLPEY
jgi:hypothetical protein